MLTDDQLFELLGKNAELFAAYEEWANAQIMLLAGTVDDPNSFNQAGGKTGALGYYPVVNVSGQTIYVPCQARLMAIALGGENAEGFELLLAQVTGKLADVDAAIGATRAAAGHADERGAYAGNQGDFAKAKGEAAQGVVDASANILAAVPVTQLARDTAVAAVGSISNVLVANDRYYYDGRQAALATVDIALVPDRVVLLDGAVVSFDPPPASTAYATTSGSSDKATKADFATSAGSAASAGTAASIAGPGGSISGLDRYYLDGRHVATATVDDNLAAISVTWLDGSTDAPSSASGPLPVDVTGGLLTTPDRYYLDGKFVIEAVVDTELVVASATMLDGAGLAGGGTPIAPVVSLPPIVCAGDSLTAAGYGNVIAASTGRSVTIVAIGGQTSRHIVGRISAVAYRLTLDNNRIVAGSNNVSAINGAAIIGMASARTSNVQFLSTGSTPAEYSATGWLGSVHGKLTRTATGGPASAPASTAEFYNFVPDAGSILPVTCPPQTPFVVDYDMDDRTHVLWLGRNNYDDPTQVLADTDAAVRRIGHNRIVIMPPPNGNYPSERASAADPSGYNKFRTIENGLAEKYPRFYLPIRRLLIDKALPALGITPTDQDLIDIADDTVPASIRIDGVHHTQAARGFIAAEVNAYLVRRGI